VSRPSSERAPCPIARVTALVGDAWTPLLLRNVSFGQRRFDELQHALGMPRASLAQRLARLVAKGLLEKRLYQERPPRFEYHLTEQGRAFFDVLAAMWRFGEDWLFPERRAPIALVERASGRSVRPLVVDEATRAPLDPTALRLRSAPARD
jgi:DNA-binding HxlR family transcriptional regulator